MTNLTQTQTVNDNAIHAELAQAFAELQAREGIEEIEATEAVEDFDAIKSINLLDNISQSAAAVVTHYGQRKSEALGDWSSYVHLAVLHGEAGKQAQKSLVDHLSGENPERKIGTLIAIMNDLTSNAMAADEASKSRTAYQQVMHFARTMEKKAGVKLAKVRGGTWVAMPVVPPDAIEIGAVSSTEVKKTAAPKKAAKPLPNDFDVLVEMAARRGVSEFENLVLNVLEYLGLSKAIEEGEAEEQQA